MLHFDFAPGLVLARKYDVLARVGTRQSGELYRLSERATGIERTGKFFSPTIDPYNRVARLHAQRLHRLRHCHIVNQYRTQETIAVGGRNVTFLVSDSVPGEALANFLARQPGQRLSVFAGLHLLHAMTLGIEPMHAAGETHGELDMETLVVQRQGLRFNVKALDLSPVPRLGGKQEDVYQLIRLFYRAIGGPRQSATHPAPVKALCSGLSGKAARDKFRHAGELKVHLENLHW